MTLERLVIDSAARTPEAPAVRDAQGVLTYRELDEGANRVARFLLDSHVAPGDRVGIWLEKSAFCVTLMQGVLRAGAAYVPLDPMSPSARVLTILRDCPMHRVFTTRSRAEQLVQGGLSRSSIVAIDDSADENVQRLEVASAQAVPRPAVDDDSLAYILYTSGSTGVPKGVCISHRNALAFIEWAAEEIQAGPQDRFANHAPFFFDLSVLDLYVAFLRGARVSIIPEVMAFSPRRLVEFILTEEISVWYSVPSALILMMAQGELLEQRQLPLRVVLFAGEPFPLQSLRTLRRALPTPRFLNLYGPTETNVCTFYEVEGEIPESRTEPIPIGKPCCGDTAWIEPEPGEEAQADVGELIIEGPTVMLGYWGGPPQGRAAYRTGDIVRRLPDGGFQYIARRDNMVKVRGRRIEPGEIEAALLQHPAVAEVAVVVAGADVSARLVGFIVPSGDARPSLLELKRVCADRVPRYMIIDEVRVVDALPRTRNGKTDRRSLVEWASRGS